MVGEEGKISLEYAQDRTDTTKGPLFVIVPNDIDDLKNLIHKDDLPEILEKLNSTADDGATWSWTGRVNQDVGEPRWFRAAATARTRSDGKVVWYGIALDVSVEVQLRERVAQSQKIEAIGQLVGGVAHDFNNLLAIICGDIELLLEEAEEGYKDKDLALDLLTATLAAARRGGDLTKNLLAYARKSPLAPELLNINDAVRETEGWLRRSIPENIVF